MLGLPRSQGRNRGVWIRLYFFPAESAAHAQALHGDLVPRKPEHARHDFLGLTGMLCGRFHHHAAGFIEPRERALGLKIKMFLAANRQLAHNAVWTLPQRGVRITPNNSQRAGVVVAGCNRVFNREDRRQWLVLGQYQRSADARSFQSLAQHPGNGLLVKYNFRREKWFIVPRCAGVVFTADIRACEYIAYTWLGECSRCVQPGQLGMSMRRQHRPGMQHIGKPTDKIIGIERFAGNMAAGAFMRDGLADDLHATASSRCSHQNFSSKDCASANRYAAEPRWSLIGLSDRSRIACARLIVVSSHD